MVTSGGKRAAAWRLSGAELLAWRNGVEDEELLSGKEVLGSLRRQTRGSKFRDGMGTERHCSVSPKKCAADAGRAQGV